ncbi:MAG TPA: crosslink repair DNA glycosylase YcaQ family protein, partial [Polyangiales bacterium]|nr:crosslink repair DNA glycosylase YcaQ family protein [Polyangiales bacterium]
VISASSSRQAVRGLDAATFRKVEKLLVRALEGGKSLTREAARALLERSKIRTDNNRLYHCLWRLAMEQVLCCGAPEGKEQTFVLLDEHVPAAKPLQPEEALVKLAVRYFAGHGPATQQDLMRWAGLSGAEARRAIAGAGKKLGHMALGDETYYVAAGRPPPTAARATIIHDGQVIGTWKASATKRQTRIAPKTFTPLSAASTGSLEQAAQRYGAFLGKPCSVV